MIGRGEYDENLMAAELRACSLCRREYYTTVPTNPWTCLQCRREAARRGGSNVVLANRVGEGNPVLAGHAPEVPAAPSTAAALEGEAAPVS